MIRIMVRFFFAGDAAAFFMFSCVDISTKSVMLRALLLLL